LREVHEYDPRAALDIFFGAFLMLGSSVLETAIGLVFVYLVFATIASGIAEYFSAYLDRRGNYLKHVFFNLFDNDDPRGRALLNLFVGHPLIQALDSTNWAPQFKTAVDRLGAAQDKFALARTKWQAAADVVSSADRAIEAAKQADSAAKRAANAASAVTNALKTSGSGTLAANHAVESAVREAEAACAAALAATTAVDSAARSAKAAQLAIERTKTAAPDRGGAAGSQTTSNEPDGSFPGSSAVASPPQASVPPAAAAQPAPALPASGSPQARASAAAACASNAAAGAKKSAADARAAAAAAQKAKQGLDTELINLVKVPKYVPDKTFVDVLLHVLTDDETIRALSPETHAGSPPASSPGVPVTTFSDRLSSALRIISGVASRLPEGDVKSSLTRCIATITESFRITGTGLREAAVVFAQLEQETNELRAVIAAVPDEELRMDLQHEIDTSLRPLLNLGHQIVLLERAGQAIAMMAESSIKTALTAFLVQAGDDLEKFKNSLCSWYNEVMEHASGWYKRNTQFILFGIGAVLCLVNNVDTVDLVRRLSIDPALRASALAAAEKVGGEGMDAVDKLSAADIKQSFHDSKLPLWWTEQSFRGFSPKLPGSELAINYFLKALGLAISALAVSMGAPFWFDVLNKLVNIRLVGKRPEPSVPPASSGTGGASTAGASPPAARPAQA
jgi:hypothetical protein